MKSRERVFKSIAHQEADRVPLALWGGPYGMVDELYYQVLELLGFPEPVPTFRRGHTVNHLDDRVLKALGTDTRYVWPGANPTSPRYPTDDPQRFLDSFGQIWIQTLPYYAAGEGLLRDAESPEDIDQRVSWPDIEDPEWTAGVGERAAALQREGEYYIIGRMVTSHGPFQLASDLRGMDVFLLDMAIRPAFAHALLERVTAVISGLTARYLEAAAGRMDMIELPGDDYATNENLIFSPDMFREFIKPCLRTVIGTIRNIQPDIKIMLHSDGAIADLIPEFIDLGVDVLHPLEPVSGLDVPAVKQEYGQEIAFLGGIDISRAMPGSISDVRRDVDRCLAALADGGGYILSPSNHLQQDVPPENVIELFRYAREAGAYS